MEELASELRLGWSSLEVSVAAKWPGKQCVIMRALTLNPTLGNGCSKRGVRCSAKKKINRLRCFLPRWPKAEADSMLGGKRGAICLFNKSRWRSHFAVKPRMAILLLASETKRQATGTNDHALG